MKKGDRSAVLHLGMAGGVGGREAADTHAHKQLDGLREGRDGLLGRLFRADMLHSIVAIPLLVFNVACKVHNNTYIIARRTLGEHNRADH